MALFIAPPCIDSASARDRADALLQFVLPPGLQEEWRDSGTVTVTGRRHVYCMDAHRQTKVFSARGRHIADACLLLTIPAPAADRVLAEYLLIRNDEKRYWLTANVFRRTFVTDFAD